MTEMPNYKTVTFFIILFTIYSCAQKDPSPEQIIRKMSKSEFQYPEHVIRYRNNILDTISTKEWSNGIKLISFTDGRCEACIDKLLALEGTVSRMAAETGKKLMLFTFSLLKTLITSIKIGFPDCQRSPYFQFPTTKS